jgi:hypothetical protein
MCRVPTQWASLLANGVLLPHNWQLAICQSLPFGSRWSRICIVCQAIAPASSQIQASSYGRQLHQSQKPQSMS